LIFVSSRLGPCGSGEYLVSSSKLQNDRTGTGQGWVLVSSCRPRRLNYINKTGVWSRVAVKPQVVIGQAGFKMRIYGQQCLGGAFRRVQKKRASSSHFRRHPW
jgi:hypothetical protein